MKAINVPAHYIRYLKVSAYGKSRYGKQNNGACGGYVPVSPRRVDIKKKERSSGKDKAE